MARMSSFAKAALAVAGFAWGFLWLAPVESAFAQADAEVFQQLPSQEIPGQQPGWFVNATLDAMTDAVERNRPLILVMGDATSSLTIDFGRYVAPCPHFGQLAGAATFAYGSPMTDEFARRIALHLKLTDYPTISVLAPRTDFLHEVYRLEGIFDAKTAAGYLYQALVQNGYWPADRPRPAALPSHYLAYPNLACTKEGARHLGLFTD